VRRLALAALLFSALWLLLLGAVHRRYLDVLREALRRGRLDLGAAPRLFGQEGARALRQALASPDPALVETALALAPQAGPDLSASVAPLLSHPSARARALACEALGRAAAAAGAVEPLLRDPEAAVRAAAAGALLAAGAGPGPEAAREALAALARSPRAGERALAARALAAAGRGAPGEILLDLLSDPEPAVRRAALAAAGEARIPSLLPALVRALGERSTSRAAAEALAGWGPGAEGELAAALDDPLREPALRRRAAGPLGRIATPSAIGALMRHVDAEDAAIRGAVDQALARAALRHPGVDLDRERLAQVLRLELELAWRALAAAQALALPDGGGPPPAGRADAARHLLGAALRDKVLQSVDRALLLARVLRPDADLELARARLAGGTPERRAAALELLDAVLDGGLRTRVVPLLDDRPRAARLREAQGHFAAPQLAPDAWLDELLRDRSPWLLAAACHAAGELGLASAGPRVVELLGHEVPYVREAALEALGRLLPRREAAAAARRLAGDPFPPARLRALSLSAEPGPGPEDSPR
jgi:HEAT repeat protein